MKKRGTGDVTRRRKIPQDRLLGILLAGIGRHIDDTNLLREQIKIRPSSGEPNWEVSLGHTPRPAAAEAFRKARSTVRALYDVDDVNLQVFMPPRLETDHFCTAELKVGAAAADHQHNAARFKRAVAAIIRMSDKLARLPPAPVP